MSREKVLQIRGRRPRICNVFEKICNVLEKIKITLEQIFLTVGQNNYGNKIPLLFLKNFLLNQMNWMVVISLLFCQKTFKIFTK